MPTPDISLAEFAKLYPWDSLRDYQNDFLIYGFDPARGEDRSVFTIFRRRDETYRWNRPEPYDSALWTGRRPKPPKVTTIRYVDILATIDYSEVELRALAHSATAESVGTGDGVTGDK